MVLQFMPPMHMCTSDERRHPPMHTHTSSINTHAHILSMLFNSCCLFIVLITIRRDRQRSQMVRRCQAYIWTTIIHNTLYSECTVLSLIILTDPCTTTGRSPVRTANMRSVLRPTKNYSPALVLLYYTTWKMG